MTEPGVKQEHKAMDAEETSSILARLVAILAALQYCTEHDEVQRESKPCVLSVDEVRFIWALSLFEPLARTRDAASSWLVAS